MSGSFFEDSKKDKMFFEKTEIFIIKNKNYELETSIRMVKKYRKAY